MAAWMATLQFSQGGRSKLVISLICLLFVPLAICWGVYIKQSGAQLSILGWASWSVAILTASLIFTRIMGGRWKEATPILIPLIALGVIVGGAAKLTNIISSGSWSLSPANTAILIGSLSAAFIIGCLIFIAARGEQVVVVTTTGGDDEEEKEE
jgi:hypothetical protein